MKKCLLACLAFAFSAFAQSQVVDPARLPGRPDFDTGAPKDCLPAAMRVYQSLPGPPTCTWKRILSARFSNGRPNHVYCVFSLGSQIYAYDNQWGSRKVFPSDKSALSVVRALDFQADVGVYLDEGIVQQPTSITAATQTLTRGKTNQPEKSRASSRSKAGKSAPDSSGKLRKIL